jgi:hypothetical protein
MESVNNSSASVDHQNDLIEEVASHGHEKYIQNNELDEKFDDAEEDELERSSKVEENETGPRTSISQAYLDSPGLAEVEFSAHKKLNIPGTEDMTAFFAATLTIDSENPLLIEVGDFYNDWIFIVCIQAKKNTDLQLIFIKMSWLEKCPAEWESVEAMKNATGKKLVQY